MGYEPFLPDALTAQFLEKSASAFFRFRHVLQD